MKIHEYQAKELFGRYHVPIPLGKVAFSSQEAQEAAATLGGYPVVVKAQIHAGGRGKGGGVKLAKSPEEVKTLAEEIIGMTLVTH
ncbi:MAG: acetate--CoA ligase family protein, partial [Desulfosarcinaceae bacterium]